MLATNVRSLPPLLDAVNAVFAPRFGERWAQHWMDLARFSDTHGSEHDPLIPHAWRYRDYVIKAFNQDKPYNQFIKEQLAGGRSDHGWRSHISDGPRLANRAGA